MVYVESPNFYQIYDAKEEYSTVTLKYLGVSWGQTDEKKKV